MHHETFVLYSVYDKDEVLMAVGITAVSYNSQIIMSYINKIITQTWHCMFGVCVLAANKMLFDTLGLNSKSGTKA